MLINDCINGRNNEIYVIHSFLDSEGIECWELLLKQYYIYEELNENIVFDNEFLDFKNKKNVFDLDNLYVRDKLITDPIVKSIIKDYPSYRDLFMVTNKSQLVSKRTNKILSQFKTKEGYLTHSTRLNGRSKCFRVHRIVADAFIPNPENKPEVNHKDGVKDNNYPINLEWVTGKENSIHAWYHGLAKPLYGENASSAKLTNKDAEDIRNIYKNEKITHQALANRYNVAKSNITRCINKKHFNH